MNNATKSIKTDTALYLLPSRAAAWEFMRACDAAGISAGFPSLTGIGPARYVQVGIATWMQREEADRLAGPEGVMCEYDFAERG